MLANYSNENPILLQGTKKVGLLESSNGYTISNYPWAYEAWKKQQQIHWMGEEVPLGEDIKDWNGDKLTTGERNLLTQIFRFFTQSDIEVCENYLKRYIPIFKPLEVQMMMAAFTNIETIHIDSYALLLKTIGMPDAEFKAFHDYKCMSDKVNYMDSFGVGTCSDVARTLAMFGAFTEGMSLFASFAMLMNFPRFNKMKGMGQIVTWSQRDETNHCDSMIKLYHQWNKETKSVTKSVKNDIIDVCKTMVSLEDKFIDLAFEIDNINGMNNADIKNYIRYIADWRLVQLKLPTIYGFFNFEGGKVNQLKPHPLPWLNVLLNGVEHANFFETRATEYSKGATRGEWGGKDGVWSMFDSEKGK